jgi:hypothetical protein
MHVTVQDESEPEGLLITYVRVWEPGIQEHIALCRRCSRHCINSLGPQQEQFLSSLRYVTAPQRPPKYLPGPKPQPPCLRAWGKRLRAWLVRLWLLLPQEYPPTDPKRSAKTPSKN